jgi:hypothetical protein
MYVGPVQQQETFFWWFAKMGVFNFDLQLRTPSRTSSGEFAWKWLSPVKNISTGYYFLKMARWARYMNLNGSDVFLRPHGEDKHGVIFLDDVPVKNALMVASKYSACVVCTSKDNTQIWMATDRKLSKNQRRAAQAHIRDLGYTDPGSISGDHLGRICGVMSQKRDVWVNLIATSFSGKYSAVTNSPVVAAEDQIRTSLNKAQHSSQSERDFGWVLGLLRSGISQEEVVRRLVACATQRNKSSPEQYAQRTVSRAAQVI